VAAAKILAVKAGTPTDLPHLPSQPTSLVLFWLVVPTTIHFVEVNFFANQYALSNLIFLDVYDRIEIK
jgi:hypothetical protein